MWKPVVRCWNAQCSRDGDHPRIAHVALADLAVGCAYIFLMLISLSWHDSELGLAMGRWIAFTDSGVEFVLFLLPDPRASLPPDMAYKVSVYRHLLVACGIATLVCTSLSRRHWPAWSRASSPHCAAPTLLHCHPDMILAARRTVALGMAAIFLLLLIEPRSDSATRLLYGNSWAFLRAPLLLALTCYFACHAAILWSLSAAQNDE